MYEWTCCHGNAVCMRGHVVLSLEQLAGNSCKVSENILCPAVIVSSELTLHCILPEYSAIRELKICKQQLAKVHNNIDNINTLLYSYNSQYQPSSPNRLKQLVTPVSI